jgi:hypothetical protein
VTPRLVGGLYPAGGPLVVLRQEVARPVPEWDEQITVSREMRKKVNLAVSERDGWQYPVREIGIYIASDVPFGNPGKW